MKKHYNTVCWPEPSGLPSARLWGRGARRTWDKLRRRWSGRSRTCSWWRHDRPSSFPGSSTTAGGWPHRRLWRGFEPRQLARPRRGCRLLSGSSPRCGPWQKGRRPGRELWTRGPSRASIWRRRSWTSPCECKTKPFWTEQQNFVFYFIFFEFFIFLYDNFFQTSRALI